MKLKVIKLSEGIYPERDLILSISKRLKNGELGILPTDTIYGFHALYNCEKCVERIDLLKKRKGKNYLMLIDDYSFFEKYSVEFPPKIKKLCELYWPGQLTLLFKTDSDFPPWCKSPEGKIGVRMPNLPFLREIIKNCGVPLISTSVNESGEMPLTNVGEIIRRFGEKVDFILDYGLLEITAPSTVLDVSSGDIKVVREGVIPSSVIEKFFRK